MCGIAGELRFDDSPPSPIRVDRMLGVLEPRGPDGTGLFTQRGVALGQCRLKVIDLTDHAAQPMVDPELGLVLVFNGCIYNYPALREDLEALGYSFFSTGDTEVILKAYHAWGADCVQHFSGMFAFVVWERDTGRVFMARDRMGVKPLYIHKTDKFLRFASSLPALLAAGGVDTRIDPVALHHYMTFHAVVPAPHTILRGVKKLPPETTLTIEPDGTERSERFWRLDYTITEEQRSRPREEWADRVHEVLRASVKGRLEADVPVGVLLSGGVDSSLIVGLLSELGQKDISTFSVGFEAVGETVGDEFKYSDLIARRYSTNHHKIVVSDAQLRTNLGPCIRSMAEPMVSHDAIGFYLLGRAVSQHIKVVQSGQGADEVFGGYHWYPTMLETPVEEAVDAYMRVFSDRSFDGYRAIMNPDYVGEDYARSLVERHFSAPGAPRAIDKALRIDTQVMLVDDPVKRVDNMTMAWGLEARVPFLDHEVVELAAKIPARHKLADGGKGILKDVARRVIPAEVIDRPKGYFPVPALKHMTGPYLEMAREILAQDAARQRGLFQPSYVDALLADPAGHLTPLGGSKLWQVVLLEYWLQEQGV
ncbi:MAG: N-acetylglutaminylglutamine amidotransferase [Alphaproteobacteria bacterium]|jgi:asparagine synthase (glutamine-hydrolysing)|nr:N-acetylglutaminylglutamine amidotransferase [Alphaproteobacteria bacterium]